MAQQIQLRRGTAAAATAANPILANGELAVETDTKLYKIGDGVTAWNSLGYYTLAPLLSSLVLTMTDTDPSTPSAGRMNFYSKNVSGRALPKFKGPSGLDSTLQPAFFANGIQCYLPGTSTAMNVIGGPALTAVGTVSHPTLAGTNLRTQTSRANFLSAATANSAAEARVAFGRVWRGNITGGGGFFHRTRFAIPTTTTNQRVFIGFNNATTAFATTQEPNALTTMIGVGNGLGETTLRMYTNDAAGTATAVDLGSSFPANDPSAVYDLTIFCAPNDSKISYEVINLSTMAVATGNFTTDLPLETTFLAYHAYINNGGTAAAVSLDIMRIYTETDY